jgi:hypothetical protein
MGMLGTRPIKVSRSTERPRPVHEVRHPLPPELLVAEFAGELPPEVAQIVRQHVATCESCGDRAYALMRPYELLAELGQEPVPYVPDLRRPVRLRLEREHVSSFLRAAGVVGRGGLATIAAMCGLALLIALFVMTSAFQAPAVVGRSANGLMSVPSAGAQGVLYAATSKVLTVQGPSGQDWPVVEVIAVDEPTGRVIRSIPASGSGLHVGRASELPEAVVLSPDGRILYELTNPRTGDQAVVAFDAHSGQILFATLLALPGGRALAPGTQALALTVAPDGQRVYVSLSLGPDGLTGSRVLVLDNAGASILGTLTPGLDAVVPEPPASASLPDVLSRTSVSLFVTVGLRPALAAGGALAVSPDGFWLFDVLDLARGGPDGQAYIMRTMPAGPTLIGQVPLGGPAAQLGIVYTGEMTLSLAADGGQAYVSADLAASDNRSGSHDIWLVDGSSATVVSHRIGFLEAGQALANWSGGDQGNMFVLLNGQVMLLPHDLALTSAPPTWLSLKDGTAVWRLVGTGV